MEAFWLSPAWIRQAQILLDSYEHFLGEPLLERSGDTTEDAERLFRAPFVVVSHGLEDDPILNYGNAAALALWEMDVASFTATPSRRTAEPDQRAERATMLGEAAEQGYFKNYRGVRISGAGRRFQIDRATVWRLWNESQPAGQAATFSDWRFLDET